MSKLTDALRRRFRTPQQALKKLGLDASLLAQDAVAHDPHTGQFTAGHGASPSTKGEHRQQSAFHKGEAEKHFKQMHEHRSKGNLAGERESGGKWREQKKLAEHHEVKSRAEMVPTGTGRSIPRSQVSRATRGLLGWRGKDRALAGDSKEKDMPETKLSPTALLAVGAVDHYLRPRMAADAAIPIIPLFKGVTAANFAERTPGILAGIRRAVRGKMAADADIEDLGDVLDRVDDLVDEGREVLGEARSDEEDGTEEQAAGENEEEAKDSPELLAQIREFLADKLGPEDLARVDEMIGAEAPEVPAADETEEEREANARERREVEGRSSARDRTAKDALPVVRPLTKSAMDAAIKAAVAKSQDDMRAVHAALADVRPWVGDIGVAFDSAEDVYREALTGMGVAEAATIHPSALKTVLGLQPKPGARPAPRLAHDAAASAKGFADRFPNASRVGRA